MFIKHIIVNVTAVIIYNRLTSSKQVPAIDRLTSYSIVQDDMVD